MRKYIWVSLLLSSALFAAVSSGQIGNQPQRKGFLPPEAYLGDRVSVAEQQLARLRESESVMGASHPQLPEVRRRIQELEIEVENLRSVPNPFTQFEEQGVSPPDIVARLSEQELRVLVVRLALDVKDLRQRVAALERFNPTR